MKKMNWKRTVHTCYGCEYYHDENGFNNKGYNSKYCGKDHYKCPYFLGIADEAVEKWETERSKKTRQSEFLKMFPNALKDGGVLVVRPCNLEGTTNMLCESKIITCEDCKREYWLTEVE